MDNCQGMTTAPEPAGFPAAHAEPLGGSAAACGDLLPIELSILDHYGRQSRCALHSLPAILGRNEQADVKLTDPWVSHEHCKLLQHQGVLIVRDLDSKNGVFLHAVRVLEAEIHPGDCLTLGRTEITIRYREPSSAQGVAAPQAETAPTSPRRRITGPHTEELLY